MTKAEFNFDDNSMKRGKSFINTSNNFEGKINANRNELEDVDHFHYQRDQVTLETVLLEHLRQDTAPELIQRTVKEIQALEHKNQDTIFEKLNEMGIKTYLETGLLLSDVATAITQWFQS